MTAPTNTILAADTCKALDVEFNKNFDGEYDKLADILGIISPEIVQAGHALYQYKVTGSLNAGDYAEGDDVPLSKYTVEREPVGAIAVQPYRKVTTAKSILTGGVENAILKTDRKAAQQVRNSIVGKFFEFLANGTSSAYGAGLQMALAQADATLSDQMETNDDAGGAIVHFLNTFDVADYLGVKEVTTQTVFGMSYLQSFLGIENVFTTNKVSKGSFFVTPSENIHMYAVDFAGLGDAGLSYSVSDSGLIGVHHEPIYNRVSAETDILTGTTMIAEAKNYIVHGAVGDLQDSWSVGQLTAFAAAKGIDISGKTTQSTILAAIKSALPGA